MNPVYKKLIRAGGWLRWMTHGCNALRRWMAAVGGQTSHKIIEAVPSNSKKYDTVCLIRMLQEGCILHPSIKCKWPRPQPPSIPGTNPPNHETGVPPHRLLVSRSGSVPLIAMRCLPFKPQMKIDPSDNQIPTLTPLAPYK